jgi:hypothetical protein
MAGFSHPARGLARKVTPTLSHWSVASALASVHQGGSDSAALGGAAVSGATVTTIAVGTNGIRHILPRLTSRHR